MRHGSGSLPTHAPRNLVSLPTIAPRPQAAFPTLVKALGLPPTSTVVPFNLVNATVAYAVEDIVLGQVRR